VSDADAEHVMVDIETLGTDPGAAIVSIGAVRFDADGIEAQFFESVDIESAQAAGLSIDAETLAWWLEQSEAAREQLFGGNQLRACLRRLSEFVGDRVVWACSPAFDVVLLEAAYRAVELSPPWRFYRCRDYRSFRETLSTWPDREQSGTAHNALDDAVFQAACLIDAVSESDEVTL
jgi:DNA polymerase III epsilon subunit-like protein